jgi:hypothetical protein
VCGDGVDFGGGLDAMNIYRAIEVAEAIAVIFVMLMVGGLVGDILYRDFIQGCFVP